MSSFWTREETVIYYMRKYTLEQKEAKISYIPIIKIKDDTDDIER